MKCPILSNDSRFVKPSEHSLWPSRLDETCREIGVCVEDVLLLIANGLATARNGESLAWLLEDAVLGAYGWSGGTLAEAFGPSGDTLAKILRPGVRGGVLAGGFAK